MGEWELQIGCVDGWECSIQGEGGPGYNAWVPGN